MQEQFEAMYTSGEFREKWDYVHPSAELISFIATAKIPEGAQVLDVGCGAGREAVFLASQNYKAIGVDFSKEALKIAETRAREAEVTVDWRQGDVLDLPVETGSIDFVNDRGCFHVISEDQRGQYASELSRVLRPGGRILLRGCREHQSGLDWFTLVTPEAIDRHFSEDFTYGPVLALSIISDASREEGQGLKSNLVVLEKK
ncbi:Methyltransferase domain-containing protein [Marininema mesophilum]|uniref:Methyltransferase domain-containing protein n=1 Tax=Marininema mesophilum TaxID=1048340 RepID=A0A1H3BA50_9BACL|nr:class I SAM-dependent methyltransferase [Marininema mesophilum]SDX38511.1 Methyltransferase domain-containing protein [Marininema mesophilum]